eukprot:EG_transcript_785
MAARFCPACGNRQPEGNFCGVCGRAMPTVPAAAPPPMSAPAHPPNKASPQPIDNSQQRALEQVLRELKEKDTLVSKLQGECKELAAAVMKHREELQSQHRSFELKALELETKHREAMADFAHKQRQQYDQKLNALESRQQEALLHYDKKLTNLLDDDRIQRKRIKALQEDSTILAADRDRAQDDVRSLRAQVARLDDALQKARDNEKSLQAQVMQHKKEREVAKASAESAAAAMRPLSAELETAQARLRKFKADAEVVAGRHATELSRCETENQRLNAELTKSKHRTVELLTRVTDLETVVLQKTKDLAMVNTELQLALEQCSAVHAAAQAQANVAEARRRQRRAEEEMQAMQDDLNTIRRLLLTEEVVASLREAAILKRPGSPAELPPPKRACHGPSPSPPPPLTGEPPVEVAIIEAPAEETVTDVAPGGEVVPMASEPVAETFAAFPAIITAEPPPGPAYYPPDGAAELAEWCGEEWPVDAEPFTGNEATAAQAATAAPMVWEDLPAEPAADEPMQLPPEDVNAPEPEAGRQEAAEADAMQVDGGVHVPAEEERPAAPDACPTSEPPAQQQQDAAAPVPPPPSSETAEALKVALEDSLVPAPPGPADSAPAPDQPQEVVLEVAAAAAAPVEGSVAVNAVAGPGGESPLPPAAPVEETPTGEAAETPNVDGRGEEATDAVAVPESAAAGPGGPEADAAALPSSPAPDATDEGTQPAEADATPARRKRPKKRPKQAAPAQKSPPAP